jgi:hypothetical protein
MKKIVKKIKCFASTNAEVLTGIVALVVVYFIVGPLIALVYPVAMLPPESILKPFLWLYEIAMIHAGLWILWKGVFPPIARYLDYKSKTKSEYNLWKDLQDCHPANRALYVILLWGFYLVFVALIAMAGVLA